jgi:hypothetical protein
MSYNVKASAVVTIRKKLQDAGVSVLAAMESKLTAETLQLFRSSGANNWIPFQVEAEILEASALVLYAGDTTGLRRLGTDVARIQLQGIYRVFVAVASADYVIKRTARIWSTLNDAGTARTENATNTGIVLAVSGIPQQKPSQREYICGYLVSVIEMTGAHNVQVTRDDSNPNDWCWRVIWSR